MKRLFDFLSVTFIACILAAPFSVEAAILSDYNNNLEFSLQDEATDAAPTATMQVGTPSEELVPTPAGTATSAVADDGSQKDEDGTASEETPLDKDGVALDAVFKDENSVRAQVMEYPPVRQADVMFSKRIWREVPFTEKLNKPLGAPNVGIAPVIINAVLNGEITAYANPEDGSDNIFKTKLSSDELKKLLAGTPEKIQYAPDPNRPDYLVDTVVVNKFDPSSIKKLRIMEDWIVDTKRSVMEPRILAIALLKDIVTESGEKLDGSIPLFWISFKQSRKVLANHKVPDYHNDVANITYDSFFVKRIFASYIIKQSNPENLRIVDKTGGQNLKALQESDHIDNELLNRQQDMWSW